MGGRQKKEVVEDSEVVEDNDDVEDSEVVEDNDDVEDNTEDNDEDNEDNNSTVELFPPVKRKASSERATLKKPGPRKSATRATRTASRRVAKAAASEKSASELGEEYSSDEENRPQPSGRRQVYKPLATSKGTGTLVDLDNAVLSHLVSRNKPVSVPQVVAEMQCTVPVGAGAAKQSLHRLASQGLITVRMAGKTSIFCPLQPEADDDEEVTRYNKEIPELAAKLETLRAQNSKLAAEKHALESEPSNGHLAAELDQLSQELAFKEERLARFEAATGKVDPKELDKLTKKLDKLKKDRKARRRIMNNITSQIHESIGMSKAKLFEEAGIDEA